MDYLRVWKIRLLGRSVPYESFDDFCINPVNTAFILSLTAEEQVLTIGGKHRAKIALV